MAFKKAKKVTLADLDAAKAEYEQIYQQVSDSWAELDTERDISLSAIEEVEELAESIKHVPVSIKTPLKKITKQKQTFVDSVELKRQERKEKMAEGAGAIAILGAGVVAVASFKDYIISFFESLFGKKSSKNTILWLVFLIVALLALVFLLVAWGISRAKTAKEAAKNTTKIKKASNELKIQQERIAALLTKIKEQRNIVTGFYKNLNCYEGSNFMSIPKEHRSDLIALMNHAFSLAEMLNAKI